MAIGSHHRPNRGATSDWITPPAIIQALGPFDLDPCASKTQPWSTAHEMVQPPLDGLKFPWEGRVWLNPPYGSEAWEWLDRLADHGDGIALVFARTETAGFVRTIWRRAHGLHFLHGRLFFHYPDGERAQSNSGAPSVLIAYGERNLEALRSCGLPGSTVCIDQRYVSR